MELTRTEIIAGMLREYETFATLIDSLDDTAWHAPTRCDGWEVRHVAGHIIGLAEDIVAGVPGSRTPQEEAESIGEDPPAIGAKRLMTAVEQLGPLAQAIDSDAAWSGPSGVPDLTMGEGILTIWYDTYVHGEDVRAAAGRGTGDRTSLRAAVVDLQGNLTKRGWGPATIAFTDTDVELDPLVISGADATAPTYEVAAADFVLAATGRLDPTTIGLDPTVNIYAD